MAEPNSNSNLNMEEDLTLYMDNGREQGGAAEDSSFLAEAEAVLSSMSPQVLSDLTDTVISTLNEQGSPVPTHGEVVRCQEEAKTLMSDQQVPQGTWNASRAPPVPKKPCTMPSTQGCLDNGSVRIEALTTMHPDPPALTEPSQMASLPRDGWQANLPTATGARPKTSTVSALIRTVPAELVGPIVRDAQTAGQHDARGTLLRSHATHLSRWMYVTSHGKGQHQWLSFHGETHFK